MENAHPHCDGSGRIWIVLNGIIENYLDLRHRLERDLVHFSSETDAEVLAHLIAIHYDGDLSRAVRRARDELCGHYAFVAMSLDEPDRLVGLRHECPLVIGLGDGEQFIASSIAAFLPHTRNAALLGDGEVAVVRANGVTVIDQAGAAHPPAVTEVDWGEELMQKEGFETYMLKEIHEQPAAVRDTLSSFYAELDVPNPHLDPARLREFRHIRIVACGTSFHAALAGKLAIERFCGDNNFVPRLGHRCSQTATVKSLVAAGSGISILPKISLKPEDKKALVYRKLSGQAPTREVVIIRHLQRYQSKGAELFLKLLRSTVSEFSATGEINGEFQPAEPRTAV